MRISEVILRLGSSLVAWMVIYAYFIWLAVLQQAGCQGGSDEMHRLLVGILPFAVGGALLLGVTRPFREIHSILRWLAAPLVLLLPLGLRSVWTVIAAVNVNDLAVCGAGPSESWQTIWAPLQLLGIGICSWMMIGVWRSVAKDRGIPDGG